MATESATTSATESRRVGGVVSTPNDGWADQNSPGGSVSGSSLNRWTQNVAYKSAQGEITTTPHVNSMHICVCTQIEF